MNAAPAHPDYLNHPGHADHDPSKDIDWIPMARSQLQTAYSAAVARANKIAGREHNLVTTFALGGEIETIEQEAADAARTGDFSTHIALAAVARRLKALIPITR